MMPQLKKAKSGFKLELVYPKSHLSHTYFFHTLPYLDRIDTFIVHNSPLTFCK